MYPNNSKIRKRMLKNPYLNFMSQFREEMKSRNIRPQQIMKLGGQKWREMSAEQKYPYVQAALKARRPKRNTLKVVKKNKTKNRRVKQSPPKIIEMTSPASSEAGSSSRSEASMDTTRTTSDDND